MKTASTAPGSTESANFYLEVVPEISDYFVLSIHDDYRGRLASSGIQPSWWQPLLATPALVAGVNSVIAGVLAALLVDIALPLWASVAIGALVGAVTMGLSVVLGFLNIGRALTRAALFPSPAPDPGKAG